MDRSEEAKLLNMYVSIKEGDMGGGDSPVKSDRIATNEALKKKEKGIMARVHNKKILSKYLSQWSCLESSEFRKSSRDPMMRLA